MSATLELSGYQKIANGELLKAVQRKNIRAFSQSEIDNGIKYRLFSFLGKYINFNSESFKIVNASTKVELENLESNKINSLINLHKTNNIRYLNNFFETANEKIEQNGIFAGWAEVAENRMKEFLNKYPSIIAIIYYGMEFIYKRVMPKCKFTKDLYFHFTQGRNRLLTKTEVLGRLVSQGFDIVDFEESGSQLFFICKKVTTPENNQTPNYGPFFKMKRIGKDGEIIEVLKLRTMHAYADYLQKYVYDKFGTTTGDKLNNDFRVANWGKLFRKIWLDELPMLYNLIKGDIKIVGVRPLSIHKFNTYPEDLQKKRIKFRPGLIPPYYVDLPATKNEMFMSEEKYLDQYAEHPVITDLKYLFRASWNIIIKNARSA